MRPRQASPISRTRSLLRLAWPAALVASLHVTSPATARAQPSEVRPLPSGACAHVVDAHGMPLSTSPVEWMLRRTPNERKKLDAHCDAVGPVVVRLSPDTPRSRDDGDDIAVIGWNVHVGGGDLTSFVRRLETGALTGSPIRHYVLLLQEAHRAGGGIPRTPEGLRVPRRIAPRPRTHARDDVVTIARRLDLSLYYVPSMRNGRQAPFEDRGNAILSTLPLDGFTAIELPIARQRRIAISARIRGADRDDPAVTLQVHVVHLDAFAGLSRLWIFATGWRNRQAGAFAFYPT